jgi:crotonobetainyl-CoA:carnitine CoA-transferase CaiB-like acyl-CoA transferase
MARLNAAHIIEPRILEALSNKSAEDLFYQGQDQRIPLARVPTMAELFSVDQYRERQVFSEFTSDGIQFEGPSCPFRLMETPPKMGGEVSRLGADNALWDHGTSQDFGPNKSGFSSSIDKTSPPPAPLEGVTIVDLSMGWAGPLATRNLADLGAKVIKVESCTRFDWFRSWEASQEWIDNNGAEKAHNFIYVNRQKLGVTIDFESKSGRDLLLELVKGADAVVDNYPTGVLEKLNLDYHVMREVKPDIVMLSMPAFGRTGPWAKFRAYGSTVEQAAGLPHLQGEEADPPTMLHVAFGDAVSGLYGTAALLTALRHKKKTGVGQFVDLSQAECMLPHAIHGILCQSVNGHAPARQGNHASDYFVHQVFPCKGRDQWILIQIKSEAEWESVMDMIPTLRSFSCLEPMERRAKLIEIEAVIGEWTSIGSAKDLMAALQAVCVPAAILNDVADLMEDPHLVSRGYMQFLSRAFVGEQPHPSAPWRFGDAPIRISSSAPTLGQHNQDILGGLLGLSNGQIASLSRDGIIGNKPRLA